MNNLVATISPQIEYDIVNKSNIKKYYTYFEKLFDFAEEYPHLLQILLPNEVCTFFFSEPFLRSYIEEMDTTDIGIYRLDYTFKECQLCFETPNDIFPDGKTNQIIANQFSKNNIPILFDISKIIYIKTNCSGKNNNCDTKFCKNRITLETSNLFLQDLLESEIEKCCKTNLQLFNKTLVEKKYIITINELKSLCLYFGVIFCDDLNELQKIINVTIIPEFLESDVKISSFEQLRIIASSISRAILFPSITESKHSLHSLDWHRNNLCPKLVRNKEDYFFYKIDAIPENRTGNGGGSGKNRILMVKYKGMDYIIGYTEEHDFNTTFCSHKLDKLLNYL